ncbi:MAG: MoaD/ThiS family protein [Phycisphaerales bacterium]|nr:MoaD/ThiS family protein [Phycisphaerales bacterium]
MAMNDPCMHITVRYWAVLADRIGYRTERLELPEAATVRTAMDLLSEQHDIILTMRAVLATAIQDQYVTTGYMLQPNDELSLIPPVSGG